jgi:hypothetical protein
MEKAYLRFYMRQYIDIRRRVLEIRNSNTYVEIVCLRPSRCRVQYSKMSGWRLLNNQATVQYPVRAQYTYCECPELSLFLSDCLSDRRGCYF